MLRASGLQSKFESLIKPRNVHCDSTNDSYRTEGRECGLTSTTLKRNSTMFGWKNDSFLPRLKTWSANNQVKFLVLDFADAFKPLKVHPDERRYLSGAALGGPIPVRRGFNTPGVICLECYVTRNCHTRRLLCGRSGNSFLWRTGNDLQNKSCDHAVVGRAWVET